MTLGIGCTNNDPSLNATRLRISLTDEPIGNEPLRISELNVDIQKIEVSMLDSIDNTESWTTLDYNGGAHNILNLTNGKTKQIVDQYFQSGILRRIKITFGDNTTVKTPKGNRTLVLDPSMREGFIATVNANLYANYVSNILVDINAALSIYEQNDNIFFRPVIRVFPETYGGSLKGYVLPPEANPYVVITNEKDTIMSIPEAKDGLFLFRGLAEDKWDIYVFADPTTNYADTIFTDSVFVGKTTELKSKIILKEIDDNNDGDTGGGDGGDNNNEED